MEPSAHNSHHLFVANLQTVSLEKLVRNKFEVFFKQLETEKIEKKELELYKNLIEPVEKVLIEVALTSQNGNQAKTAQILGINRNTLKRKIDSYKIQIKKRITT